MYTDTVYLFKLLCVQCQIKFWNQTGVQMFLCSARKSNFNLHIYPKTVSHMNYTIFSIVHGTLHGSQRIMPMGLSEYTLGHE